MARQILALVVLCLEMQQVQLFVCVKLLIYLVAFFTVRAVCCMIHCPNS